MPIHEMINNTLLGMAFGIPGVFLVLAIFYVTLKLMMMQRKRPDENPAESEQDTADK